MKKLLIFLSILCIIFAGKSFANTLKKPNESDIESTCRTLLYEVVKNKGKQEKIIVLNATYKMVCSEINDAKIELIHREFASIGKALADRAACLSSSGFVSSGITGGWTHHEVERFQLFNQSTNGGWDHNEIEKYLVSTPLIGDLSKDELLRYKALTQNGYELDKMENAVNVLKLQRFQEIQPQIQDINNRLESLNIDSFRSNKFNNNLQLTPQTTIEN
jgi:hypothetical protein